MIMLSAILLSACIDTEKVESDLHRHDTVTVEHPPVDSLSQHAITAAPNQARYFYEPDTAIISGTMIEKTFYGPPGYGESPATDSQESFYLLVVPQPVKIFSNSQEQEAEGIDVSIQDIDTIQLIPSDSIRLKPFLHRKVQLHGTFSGAVSGHHHTSVLLWVIKADAVK